MRLKRGGRSGGKSGALVTGVAVGLISAISPAEGQDSFLYFGFTRDGRPLIIDYVPEHRDRMKWSMSLQCYVPYDSQYSPYVFGRRKADGEMHSGWISYEDSRNPDIRESDFIPTDLEDVYGKGPHVRWPIQHVRGFSQEQWDQKCAEQKKAQELYKSRIDARRKKAAETRKAEGLNEVALFRYYFDSLGEDYSIEPMSCANKTVATLIKLPSHNLAIYWHDEKAMNDMLQHKGRAGFARNYQRRVYDLQQSGTNIAEITNTDETGIISELERITALNSLGRS